MVIDDNGCTCRTIKILRAHPTKKVCQPKVLYMDFQWIVAFCQTSYEQEKLDKCSDSSKIEVSTVFEDRVLESFLYITYVLARRNNKLLYYSF